MKIRLGFVSNSSSSSFCLFGLAMSPSVLAETIKKNCGMDRIYRDRVREQAKKMVNDPKTLNNEEDMDLWLEDLSDSVFEFAERITGMEVSDGGSEGGTLYIGRPWSSIGDDETGSQFKRKVERELGEFMGTEVKCVTHQEGWYDG